MHSQYLESDKVFCGCLSYLLLSIFVFGGCSQPKSSDKKKARRAGPPMVAVVNAPLHYFVRRIGGDEVQVFYPASKASEPASWKPSVSEINQLQNCDLIFLNGADFSLWLQTVSLPQSKTINTSESYESRYIALEESFVHRHGPKGNRSEKTLVATTWLDLEQASGQAEAVRDGLIDLLPEKASELNDNCDKLVRDLMSLDKEMAEACQPLAAKTLIANAPIYQYLARRYQLKIVTVPWDDVSKWDVAQEKRLRETLHQTPSKHFIWNQKPSEEIRKRLSNDFQLNSLVVDPAGFGNDNEDWFAKMKQNVSTMKSIAYE